MEELELLPVKRLQAKVAGKDEYKTVLVDGDYDGEWFEKMKLGISKGGYVMVHNLKKAIKNESGYRAQPTYLHHLILAPREGLWVTFKNGNKLDLRSANIIYRTPKESTLSRKQHVRKNGRKYRGVQHGGKTYVKPWVVFVRGKYMGCFPTEEEAAREYDKHAKKIWGDRAILNFKEDS